MNIKEVLQKIDWKIASLEELPPTDYRNGALTALEELRWEIKQKGGMKWNEAKYALCEGKTIRFVGDANTTYRFDGNNVVVRRKTRNGTDEYSLSPIMLADAFDWKVVEQNEGRSCEKCKHSEWFAEYAMTVCEKHGDVDMREVCEDYEEKGGENEA